MEPVNTALLLGALLLFVSVLASVVSARLGFPLLLVFLVVGMLAGEDGPGRIPFVDFELSFLVGNLALAVILLDGGLRTRVNSFRVALRPALALATLGVALTAATVGAAAMALLGVDWRYGMLLGAIVGSTDAAAVFSVLRHSGVALNERVGATLEIESGINDPMAIFLTVALLELSRDSTAPDALTLMTMFLGQLGIGAAGGALLGYVLRAALRRIRLAEGLYALFVVSGGVAGFAAINWAGGSGFLGIYLIGLIVGSGRGHAAEHVMRVMDGLAWLAQAGMFLILGLLVTPSAVLDRIGPALGIAAVLLFVARPLAVALTLAPFRFAAREIAYVSWVGLRGAVPIVLALFPIIAGLAGAKLLFEITYVVVIASLLLQGSTVAWAARRLRVEVPPATPPRLRSALHLPTERDYELVQFVVGSESPAQGQASEALRLPANSRAVAVARGGTLAAPDARALEAGDIVCVLVPQDEWEAVSRQFCAEPGQGQLASRLFFGDFVLEGDARMDDVITLYGLRPADVRPGSSLGEYVEARLGRKPVVGDAVDVGAVELTVREMSDGAVAKVGLKLKARR